MADRPVVPWVLLNLFEDRSDICLVFSLSAFLQVNILELVWLKIAVSAFAEKGKLQ